MLQNVMNIHEAAEQTFGSAATCFGVIFVKLHFGGKILKEKLLEKFENICDCLTCPKKKFPNGTAGKKNQRLHENKV